MTGSRFMARRSQLRCAGIALSACLVLGSACTIGAGDDGTPTLTGAIITVADPIGVADGVDRVELTISGDEGVQVTLDVAGGGVTFAAPDDEPADGTKKTVVLTGGTATANLIATTAGDKRVSFELDPLNSVKDVTFKEVTMETVTPTAFRYAPGAVVHVVCVGLNTPNGKVKTENTNLAPLEVDVTDQPPSVGSCPSGAAGYARFDWTTTAPAMTNVTLAYIGPGDAELERRTLELDGEDFPGYDVTAMTPEVNGGFISVKVDVRYRAGTVSAGPAAGVDVVQRLVPMTKLGPTFLGSSSGDSAATPRTDVDGKIELFYSNSPDGTYALFLTPVGGGAVHAADLVITSGTP